MKYTRLFADEQGESHLEDLEMSFTEMDFAPPIKPIRVSEPMPAKQMVIIHFPPGTVEDYHPSPKRQFCVILSGVVKGGVSNGESRIFRPGEMLLMEDTTGKGHTLEVLGDEECFMAMTQLE